VNSNESTVVRWLDRLLLAELAVLTFLLGSFLDRDTDIWWHLRAGRDMLAGGPIPRTDSYVFATQGAEWIDVHWGFQLAAAWLHAHYGFAALTVATAVAAVLAIGIVLATRRERSTVALVWCWLPAIFVASARFFPRPEILSFVCLAAFLWILDRADHRPVLLWLLVLIQLVWINVHSLFVLGWVIVGCWLIDRAIAGALSQQHAGWRHRWLAPIAMVLVAFVNPYTWKGVTFPVTLFSRMSTERDFYGTHIGELMSIPAVVMQTGVSSVYVRVSLVLLIVTAASFALRRHRFPFLYYRLLLFLLFGALGLVATRNQPQFALVAGAVLAWNVGDWLAQRPETSIVERAVARILTSAVLVGLILWTATGRFYVYAGEGRIAGFGEHPLWFAHTAARVAAAAEMPKRIVAFHEGQAAVFEFHMRPDQQVFVDPRLEVTPRIALERYYSLAAAVARREPSWQAQLAALGQPLGLLVDHQSHHAFESGVIDDPSWRCIWFDAVAAVYVPASDTRFADRAIDFGARYFGAGNAHASDASQSASATPAERLRYAESLFDVGRGLLDGEGERRSLGRVMLLQSGAQARELLAALGASARVARLLAQSALGTYAQLGPSKFSPDTGPEPLLGLARARYFLSRALAHAPADFQVTSSMVAIAERVGDPDALWVAGSRLASLRARTAPEYELQRQARMMLRNLLAVRAAELPPLPPVTVAELLANTQTFVSAGRFMRALDTIESYLRDAPGESLPWQLADLRAMLFLLNGYPQQARQVLTENGASAPTPAALNARLASTYFVEGRLSEAADLYGSAIASAPIGPATRFGLAISRLELGDAPGFIRECRAATTADAVPSELAEFCREMTAFASRYAPGTGAD
jgi:tetratricopeptide (TPR) repeat protein